MSEAERRLTVIVSADVAGYSHLMEVDESGTVSRMKALIEEVIRPVIAAHHGRLLKLLGDGFLAEFPSVRGAVQGMLEMQANVESSESGAQGEKPIHFRVGVTAGDIIIEDDDIYGRAINVASRIQGLAEPGAVFISEAARSQLGNLEGVAYQSLGAHSVKNIREPVRVYRVAAADGGTNAVTRWRRHAFLDPKSMRFQTIVVLLAAGAVFAWRSLPEPDLTPPAEQPSVPSAAQPASGPAPAAKPAAVQEASIAVLPFTDMSAAGDQEYFSDGIAEELLNLLVRVKGLRVAARTSSFAFKGRNEDIRDIGKLLGVSTVVEGSVRKAGDKLRITAQLINVADGYHLWSQSFTRELTDIFAIQDEIANAVVAALKENLLGEELAAPPETITSRVPNMEAWDLYLLGRHHFHQRTVESLGKAAELFQRAIALDPNYAPAYTGLADSAMLLSGYGGLSLDDAIVRAQPAIEKALQLDPKLGEAYASLGLLEDGYLGDKAAGLKAFRRAIDLNPGYPMAHMWLGNLYSKNGQIRDAVQSYTRAHLLDPLHPTIATNLIGMHIATGEYAKGGAVADKLLAAGVTSPIIYRALENLEDTFGHYDKGIRWGHEAEKAAPGQPATMLALSNSYGGLGDFDAAERWLAAAEKVAPENFQAFGQRFGLLFTLGDFDGLLAHVDRRLKQVEGGDPSSVVYRSFRAFAATARMIIGRYAEGVEMFDGVLRPDGTTGFGIQADFQILGALVYAYQKLGRAAEAKKHLATIERLGNDARNQGFDGPAWLPGEAVGMVLGGKPQAAVKNLQAAYAAGWRDYYTLATAPVFEGLRERDDVKALLARMKADLEVMRARVDAMNYPGPEV